MSKTTIAWAINVSERRQAAQFFARVIARDSVYISHGEIQTALSLDGASWAPDLEARFVADLEDIDDTTQVALAHGSDGALVGAGIVSWSFDEPEAPFATLQDIAVDEKSRGIGVGVALTDFILAEAAKRGVKWAFLESGKNNHHAHTFFERAGFSPFSIVFVKRL